jgi:hypothetical protein
LSFQATTLENVLKFLLKIYNQNNQKSIEKFLSIRYLSLILLNNNEKMAFFVQKRPSNNCSQILFYNYLVGKTFPEAQAGKQHPL